MGVNALDTTESLTESDARDQRVLDVTKVNTNLVPHLRVTEVLDVTKVHTNLVPHLKVTEVLDVTKIQSLRVALYQRVLDVTKIHTTESLT